LRQCLIRFILGLSLFLVGCVSFPGKRSLSYIYMNPRNCGFFQFYRDGSFRYLLGNKLQEKCTDNQSMPEASLGDIGKYSFDAKDSLAPSLFLNSVKIDGFEIRFSEDLKNLFLKRKNSNIEEQFNRMK
jgi:hypothetical protein